MVTTRIITFLVGNPYKPSFATITGKGDNPIYTHFGGNQTIGSNANFEGFPLKQGIVWVGNKMTPVQR